MDNLICIDIWDQPIGKASKEECHFQGLLHRAFSVFLHCDGKLLLQQRALFKYHSGGLWTNACCSHPRYGETLDEAVPRRLQDELGIRCVCQEIGSFSYFHKFNDHLFEYELDHIYLGAYDGPLIPNPEEIIALSWVALDELAVSLQTTPQRYTAWFLIAAPMVLKHLSGKP